MGSFILGGNLKKIRWMILSKKINKMLINGNKAIIIKYAASILLQIFVFCSKLRFSENLITISNINEIEKCESMKLDFKIWSPLTYRISYDTPSNKHKICMYLEDLVNKLPQYITDLTAYDIGKRIAWMLCTFERNTLVHRT